MVFTLSHASLFNKSISVSPFATVSSKTTPNSVAGPQPSVIVFAGGKAPGTLSSLVEFTAGSLKHQHLAIIYRGNYNSDGRFARHQPGGLCQTDVYILNPVRHISLSHKFNALSRVDKSQGKFPGLLYKI